MEFIQKTVFISYRRTNLPWAIAISQHLEQNGYDVFFDYTSIKSGDFEHFIAESIKAKAHFLILLTPSAIERCYEPDDWLRREIEIALHSKRNIVPILLEGFDFEAPETFDFLTGDLEKIRKYNGLPIYGEYFNAGMERLCKQFLNIRLDEVHHPVIEHVSSRIQAFMKAQNEALAKQSPVDEKILSAQDWFERAFKSKDKKEKIRLYSKAIDCDSKFSYAYINRGISYDDLEQFEKAIEDYNKVIELDPDDADAYYNRGCSYDDLEQFEKAIEDYNKAIELDPDMATAYINRGSSYAKLEQFEKAIEDSNKAIELDPDKAAAYNNRGNSYGKLEQFEKAIEDYNKAIELDPEDGNALYNKACAYALQNNEEEALLWLKEALIIDRKKYCELSSNDSDFDRIRKDEKFQTLMKEFCDIEK